MNKMIIAAMTVLSLAAQAQQSSSALPAPASKSQTTTTSVEAVKPAAASKWSGSATMIVEQSARVKSENEDPEFSKFDSQYHLTAKYKVNASNTLGVIQRFFYSEYAYGNDGTLIPGNLRVQLVSSGSKVGNADMSMLSRVTLPTRSEDRRDYGYLGAITLVPELSWTVSPKWSTSASAYMVGSFNTHGEDTEVPGWDRDYNIFMPSVGATYSISDKLSAGGSLGYSITRRMRSMARADIVGESIEAGITMGYAATKKVNLSASINQSMPTLKGSKNPVTGKLLAFEKGNDNNTYTIGARDQVVYGFLGSVAF